MTDWIKHDGENRPADDVWVERPSPPSFRRIGLRADDMTWGVGRRYRIINQHLIDAARLEGIRLGLEAAAREAVNWAVMPANFDDAIRLLDPETIAKEADQ